MYAGYVFVFFAVFAIGGAIWYVTHLEKSTCNDSQCPYHNSGKGTTIRKAVR